MKISASFGKPHGLSPMRFPYLMVQLGKTIIRIVVAALVQALIKAVILKAIFTALGIGPKAEQTANRRKVDPR